MKKRAKPGPRTKPEQLLFHPDERIRLEPASPIPLYHQMENTILERLRSVGDSGKSMPTEMDLIRIFGVSRATIRKVSESLSAKGLIQRQRSVGTKIVSRSVSEDLGRLTSFSEQMQGRGMMVSTKLLSSRLEEPTQKVRDRLQLRPDAQVLSIRRLRGSGQVFPFVLLHSFLPASLGIDPKEDFNGSLYKTMEGKYGLLIEWAEEEISASVASPEEATVLGIKTGATLLVMERLTFGPGNTPLEFVRASYIPEHFKFTAKLRR